MQIKNVRFIIAAITTFSAYAVYVSRVNLSIAIIAMVEDGHSQQQHAAATDFIGSPAANDFNQTTTNKQSNYANFTAGATDSRLAALIDNGAARREISQSQQNSSGDTDKPHRAHLSSIFPASKQSVQTPLMSQEKFFWDQREQGHILGAFFYGYILFQIPGARMAELMGAKWIILAANAGSALISLLFPLSTQLDSIHLLMVLRFVMGLCQSAFFPAAYVLFCRWFPEKERAVLLPIMFIGSNMGSISTYIMSSYLVSSAHGWPSVFYVSGFVCTLVTIFWCLFGSNGPEDNWFISDEERAYIEANVNNQSSAASDKRSELALTTTTAGQLNAKQTDQNNNNYRLTVIPEDCLSNGLGKKANDNMLASLKKSASCCAELTSAQNSTPLTGGERRNQEARYERYASLIGPDQSVKSISKQVDNNNNQLTHRLHSTDHIVAPKEKVELSWTKLLKSVPVWTLILSMYGNEWSNVVLCFELPTYLNTALTFPIEQNGVINSFFQLSYTLASPVMSSLGAYMLDKHVMGMRKIHVRKLFQSLATFGQLACFVSVPICGANRGLIIMFMFSATVFKSCANAGDIMVPGDLSPEYAGTIFAFANSIGNTAGFCVPALAGVLVQNSYEREQWTPFWLITAAIMGCSGLIFLFLGETRRQDFSPDPSEEELVAKKEKPPKRRATTNGERPELA